MARRGKGDQQQPAPPGEDPAPAGRHRWYASRGALLAAFIAIVVSVIIGYAGSWTDVVLRLLLTDGLTAVAWVLCAASLGSFLLTPFARVAHSLSLGTPGEREGVRGASTGTGDVETRKNADGTSLLSASRTPSGQSPSPPPSPPGVPEGEGVASFYSGDVFHFVSCAALGLGVFSLMALGLGLIGWLNTSTVLLLLAASACLNPRRKLRAIMRLRDQSTAPIKAWLAQPAGWHWLWLAAAPMLGIVLVGASIVPGALWRPDDPHPYDVLEYHLQLPREWFEIGRIIPLRHNVFSFFPLNAEMQSLMAMHLRRGPYAGMYLAQFVQTACMVLAVAGVYGVIRRLRAGASPAAAVVAAVAMAVVPWTVMLASVAYDESALLLYGSIATGWALLSLQSANGRRRCLALAGAMTGFACGVKYTAAPFLLVGIAVSWFFTTLSSGSVPHARRGLIGGPIIFVMAGVLTFSPWLIKNVAWARNPVFPLGMRLLGRAHFDETKVIRFEVAHSPTAPQRSVIGRLKTTWFELIVQWQYGYALWPLALISFCLAARRPEARFLALLLLAVFITWIGFTHLLSRFFTIGIPVAALLVGVAQSRRVAAFGAAAVGAMGLLGWVGVPKLATGIHPRLHYFAGTLGQNGAFGLTDPRALIPDSIDTRLPDGRTEPTDIQALFADPGTRVALIGNAQPFVYSLPMSRLTYTTVFDVDSAAGYPAAWLPPGERAPASDRMLVIHPDEVERLADTYVGVPHLQYRWPVPLNKPFIERR